MPFTLAELEERLLIGSTLVEGSTLTEDEARAVLAGRTVTGHPVRELREILGHRSATGWLIAELDRSPFVSLDLVLGFHARLMSGLTEEAGRWKSRRNIVVRTDGSRAEYLQPAAVPDAMRTWLERLNDAPTGAPAFDAATLYGDFERIHPFEDGNGRVGRMIVAYWLHWKHDLAFRFVLADRIEHLVALAASDAGEAEPLRLFFERRVAPDRR